MNTKEKLVKQIEKQILDELEEEMKELNRQGKLHKFETAMDHAVEKFNKALKEKTEAILNEDSKESGKKKPCPQCGRPTRIVNYDSTIEVLTKHGKIFIVRDYYFCRYCHEGFTALDDKLELFSDHKATLEMADMITYAGQVAMSFEKSSELIKKFTGIEVSDSLIRSITEETGEKVFRQDIERAKESYEKPEIAAPSLLEKDKKKGVLYIMMDGSAINTIQVDNLGSSWREMKLGLVFADYNRVKRKDGKIIITEKEYVAFFGEVGEFKKLLFDAAARAGYGKIKEVVVIGDGAHWIWNMCEEIFPDAVQILDYYHLSENVHKFARYLYPDNDIEMKRWSKDTLGKLEEGRFNEVVTGLQDLEGKKLPPQIPNLKVYLENNRHRINYRQYKIKGYYIGSGAIESGNKMVIQQRMKQSGMRWSVPGGQQVAALRAKYASEQWNKVQSVIGL